MNYTEQTPFSREKNSFLEGCQFVTTLYYYDYNRILDGSYVHGGITIDIMIHGKKIMLNVGGEISRIDGITSTNSLSELLRTLDCKRGSIDIISDRKLNNILHDILRMPLYTPLPNKICIYTFAYLQKLQQLSQKLDNTHIAVSVAEFALRD